MDIQKYLAIATIKFSDKRCHYKVLYDIMKRIKKGKHTNKSERAIRLGDGVELSRTVGVDIIKILLDRHVIEHVREKAVVMNINHRSL